MSSLIHQSGGNTFTIVQVRACVTQPYYLVALFLIARTVNSSLHDAKNVLCASVEYPASALLSELQQEEGRGVRAEMNAVHLSSQQCNGRQATLYTTQVGQ